MINKAWESRPLRYIFVGSINFLLANSLFVSLYIILNKSTNYSIIYIVATLLFLPISHIMQRRFVWKSYGEYLPELSKFALVNLPGIVLTFGLVSFTTRWTSVSVISAQVFMSGLVVVFLYLVHKYWTFDTDRDPNHL
jgi:putative flippase GtrA